MTSKGTFQTGGVVGTERSNSQDPAALAIGC